MLKKSKLVFEWICIIQNQIKKINQQTKSVENDWKKKKINK